MANHLTRALQHRNYRLFFGGQSISLIGTWITRVATSWLVYWLTGSLVLLGVVAFCGQIPALNSSMVNASRILGPSIGGVVIAAVGEGWCFLIDAISYIAVIASLLMMTIESRELPRSEHHMLQELHTGFRYVASFLPVRTALILLALISTLGVPYTVLMPAIATNLLHGGPHTLGFLMASSGVGALGGALYLASRRTVVGLGRAIVLSTSAFGLGLIVFSVSRNLWLSLLLLPFVGGGMMITMAATDTIIQTIVTEELAAG
jgi:MFS family permease